MNSLYRTHAELQGDKPRSLWKGGVTGALIGAGVAVWMMNGFSLPGGGDALRDRPELIQYYPKPLPCDAIGKAIVGNFFESSAAEAADRGHLNSVSAFNCRVVPSTGGRLPTLGWATAEANLTLPGTSCQVVTELTVAYAGITGSRIKSVNGHSLPRPVAVPQFDYLGQPQPAFGTANVIAALGQVGGDAVSWKLRSCVPGADLAAAQAQP